MNNKKLTGIILAGGKSSRFGFPKYQARLDGKTLLEIAISKLRPLCDELIVVSKEPIPVIARTSTLFRGTGQSQNVVEEDKAFHPLIGIKEGLKESTNEDNLVMACDMPFVTKEMFLSLLESKAEVCVYRHKGRVEPLLGLYRKSFLQNITDFKNKRVVEVLEKCDSCYIDEQENSLAFININTKKDLDESKRIVKDNPEILGH